MTTPWRNTAIFLFMAAIVFGGFVGDQLLAVTGDTQTQLRLYTELVHLAHEQYGDEVVYRDLVYSSINGMLRALDPHTNFLSPESYENMRQRQQGSFFGLGILVSMRNGQLTVISPIEGTPAWRLGIRAGDVISTIEGEPTSSMSLDQAVSKLKGPKDTQVNIDIVRRGLTSPLELAVTRAEIPQSTVRFAYMIEPGVGYIRLTDFSRSTSSEIEKALEKLRGEGMERLLLDLRNNGGGLLDQAVAVSSFFVPESSRIVETRGRLANSYQTFYADGNYEPLDLPLVVLVNNGTASAAEILAGAIQDHDVGLVLGNSTWGKGLVQTVYNLSYGSGVALTTAKYYTPSGRLIQRDYSSYFDYYGNFQEEPEPTDVAPADDVPEVQAPEPQFPEFTTDLGRKVYGGGGITPDRIVEFPDGPKGLQFLFARNAFFDFAIDFQTRHKVEDPSWQPPESMVDEFSQWLVDNEILNEEDRDEIMSAEDMRIFARRQIHSDIFTAAFGTEESHRITAAGDDQIQAALKLLDEAEQLLEDRHQMRRRDRERVVATEAELKGRELSRPESP